jgi:predicted ATP-grasp superfamily ATP-dependent carboligase
MTSPSTGLPPVLLTKPDFCGTLAAARLLGNQGIRVSMAASDRGSAAQWSRHVSRRLRCPPLSESEAFLAWLLDFGSREPGHVLYPTSDDFAWLFSGHAEALGKVFRLYSPPVTAITTLLDKKGLHEACMRAGMRAPRSWFPETVDDLAPVAAEARFPLLIKPRTQILQMRPTKGTLVRTPQDLPAAFTEFENAYRHAPALAMRLPAACLPMLQEYRPEVHDETLVVAGFVDKHGELLAARAARKILQQPRRLGIALCLEETALDPELERGLHALCRATGFYGVFHVELIPTGDGLFVIDFNPRYYHHMAFETARGMPLPLFTYHAACGDEEALRALARSAGEAARPAGRTFTHRFELLVMVLGQRLTGRMTAADLAHWRAWYAEHRPEMTDAVSDGRDYLPELVDIGGHILQMIRHPRAFVRKVLLNSV